MDRDVRWFSLPISVQISNIGGEVTRAIRWKNKNDRAKMLSSYKKAIEFLILTQRDPKNIHRRGELQAAIEELADFFIGENIYKTNDEILLKYYDAFI